MDEQIAVYATEQQWQGVLMALGYTNLTMDDDFGEGTGLTIREHCRAVVNHIIKDVAPEHVQARWDTIKPKGM